MRQHLKTIAIAALAAIIGATVVAVAARTNYLGTVFIADTTTPTQQLAVNADGSINVDAAFTPSGTQNVNITQILGAAPSLTNPFWVFPATGATFPVSGTFWPYALGQQLAAASVPVVLTAAQVSTLTPPATAASLGAATPTSCSALCANLVIKNAGGTLFSFEVSADSTLSAAAWWIMIYNATSAPADGAVTPLKCYALPLGATAFTGAFDTGGVAFSTGIVIGVSTNGCFTKAASTHALISGDFQ